MAKQSDLGLHCFIRCLIYIWTGVHQEVQSFTQFDNQSSLGTLRVAEGPNISSGGKLRLIRLCRLTDWFESLLYAHTNLYCVLHTGSFQICAILAMLLKIGVIIFLCVRNMTQKESSFKKKVTWEKHWKCWSESAYWHSWLYKYGSTKWSDWSTDGIHEVLKEVLISSMSRDMWFPTMWNFDRCRLSRACAASC